MGIRAVSNGNASFWHLIEPHGTDSSVIGSILLHRRETAPLLSTVLICRTMQVYGNQSQSLFHQMEETPCLKLPRKYPSFESGHLTMANGANAAKLDNISNGSRLRNRSSTQAHHILQAQRQHFHPSYQPRTRVGIVPAPILLPSILATS